MNTRCYIIMMAALLLTACAGEQRDYDAAGTFEATEVTVSAEATGGLMQFDVVEGQTLALGQQVGLIDTVQLALKARGLGATKASVANQRPNTQVQIAALRQQIAKAEKERDRYAALVKDGAANQKQLDDAISTVSVLKKQLEAQVATLGNSTNSLNSQMTATDIQREQVLDQLKKCHIVAPIGGTVLEKYVELGEYAVVGKPLFKLADIDNLFLRAYVTSAQLSRVKIGQQVTVYCDYGSGNRKQYTGTVVWISSQAEFTPKTILTDDERANLVYAVKIAVKNDGNIKIGMYGEVKF